MLKEVKVVFSCNVAGYNTNKIDVEDFKRAIENIAKAYVGAKEIGILGNTQLVVKSIEE